MDIQPFIRAWNRRDPEEIARCYTEDAVRHLFTHPQGRVAGRAAIARSVGTILHAAPDGSLIARSVVIGGDGRTVFEWTFAGTFTNAFGPHPPTGESVSLPGISVFSWDGDGLIAQEHAYWDNATVMTAAGAGR